MYVFMFYDNFKLFFYLLYIFEVFLLDMIYILVFNLFIGNDKLYSKSLGLNYILKLDFCIFDCSYYYC